MHIALQQIKCTGMVREVNGYLANGRTQTLELDILLAGRCPRHRRLKRPWIVPSEVQEKLKNARNTLQAARVTCGGADHPENCFRAFRRAVFRQADKRHYDAIVTRIREPGIQTVDDDPRQENKLFDVTEIK